VRGKYCRGVLLSLVGRLLISNQTLAKAISQSSRSNPHFMQWDLLVGSVYRLRKGKVAAPSKYRYIDRPSYK
jgi:hypothetical protein